MKKAIWTLVAAVLLTGLTACGTGTRGAGNTAYRTDRAAGYDGRYYAADDGRVYDAYDPDRAGLLGNFRSEAETAADGARRTGDAPVTPADELA